MSTINDDIDFDEDTPVATDSPAGRSFKDRLRPVVEQWKLWPKPLRVLSIPAAAYLAFIALAFMLGFVGSLLGFGGQADATPEVSTTTTLVTVDPLAGLPTTAPLVASTVKAADRQEFANRVRAVTADGTSLCDVFFGVSVTTQNAGTTKAVWSVTTPKMQERSGVGVELPSAEWPVRAFYGEPCNVVERDTSLTTTTVQAVVPGE